MRKNVTLIVQKPSRNLFDAFLIFPRVAYSSKHVTKVKKEKLTHSSVIWTQISEELGGGVDKTIKGRGERIRRERALLESRNRLVKHEYRRIDF
jgi:hypothetical protein